MTAPQLIQSAISRGWVHLPDPPKLKARKPYKSYYDPARYKRRADANRALGLRFDGKPRQKRRWGISNKNHAADNREWRRRIAAMEAAGTSAPQTSGVASGGASLPISADDLSEEARLAIIDVPRLAVPDRPGERTTR